MPFSNRITLNASGKLSTRTSHEYSSVAERWASPVFRQLGHLRFSTQLSRAIRKYAPNPETFPMSLRRRYGRTKGDHSNRGGLTSVDANRLEASVQGPWTSWGLHTRQGS